MPNGDEERIRPRSRLEAQVDLILNGSPGVEEGLEGAAVWPPDWNSPEKDNVDYVDYLYRDHHILVRDADIAPVREIVPTQLVPRESNLRGLTLLQLAEPERTVDDACATLDRELGEGTATP